MATCHCSLPPILRTVKKTGPNHGRQFLTCPKAESDDTKCTFFSWDVKSAPITSQLKAALVGGGRGGVVTGNLNQNNSNFSTLNHPKGRLELCPQPFHKTYFKLVDCPYTVLNENSELIKTCKAKETSQPRVGGQQKRKKDVNSTTWTFSMKAYPKVLESLGQELEVIPSWLLKAVGVDGQTGMAINHSRSSISSSNLLNTSISNGSSHSSSSNSTSRFNNSSPMNMTSLEKNRLQFTLKQLDQLRDADPRVNNPNETTANPNPNRSQQHFDHLIQTSCKILPKSVLPYQREGFRYAIEHQGRCLFGDVMGLGKSLQSLLVLAYYKQELPALIVCPSSLRYGWRDQIVKWLGNDVESESRKTEKTKKRQAFLNRMLNVGSASGNLHWGINSSSSGQKSASLLIEQWNQCITDSIITDPDKEIQILLKGTDTVNVDAKIVITSYDLLRSQKNFRKRGVYGIIPDNHSNDVQMGDLGVDGNDILRGAYEPRRGINDFQMINNMDNINYNSNPMASYYNIVIVDESQFVKDIKSQRTKAVLEVCNNAKRCMLLSGTPALNQSVELYPQLLCVLGPNNPCLPQTYNQFTDRYCVKEVKRIGRGRSVEQFTSSKNQEELNVYLTASCMIRRQKKEVLTDLPPKLRSKITLDVSRCDKKLLMEIKKLRRQMMKELGGSEEKSKSSKSKEKSNNTNDPDQQMQQNHNYDLDSVGQLDLIDEDDERNLEHYFFNSDSQIQRNNGDPAPNISAIFQKSAQVKLNPVNDYLEHLILHQPDLNFIIFAYHKCMLNGIEEKLRIYKAQGITDYIRICGETKQSIRGDLVKKYQKDFENNNCDDKQQNPVIDAANANNTDSSNFMPINTKIHGEKSVTDENDNDQNVNGNASNSKTLPCRIALLSITAAGQGLTLTKATAVIFAELFYVPGQLQQCEDRAHRIGQKSTVNIYYLSCPGTLDSQVFHLLDKKSKDCGTVLDGKVNNMQGMGVYGRGQQSDMKSSYSVSKTSVLNSSTSKAGGEGQGEAAVGGSSYISAVNQGPGQGQTHWYDVEIANRHTFFRRKEVDLNGNAITLEPNCFGQDSNTVTTAVNVSKNSTNARTDSDSNINYTTADSLKSVININETDINNCNISVIDLMSQSQPNYINNNDDDAVSECNSYDSNMVIQVLDTQELDSEGDKQQSSDANLNDISKLSSIKRLNTDDSISGAHMNSDSFPLNNPDSYPLNDLHLFPAVAFESQSQQGLKNQSQNFNNDNDFFHDQILPNEGVIMGGNTQKSEEQGALSPVKNQNGLYSNYKWNSDLASGNSNKKRKPQFGTKMNSNINNTLPLTSFAAQTAANAVTDQVKSSETAVTVPPISQGQMSSTAIPQIQSVQVLPPIQESPPNDNHNDNLSNDQPMHHNNNLNLKRPRNPDNDTDLTAPTGPTDPPLKKFLKKKLTHQFTANSTKSNVSQYHTVRSKQGDDTPIVGATADTVLGLKNNMSESHLPIDSIIRGAEEKVLLNPPQYGMATASGHPRHPVLEPLNLSKQFQKIENDTDSNMVNQSESMAPVSVVSTSNMFNSVSNSTSNIIARPNNIIGLGVTNTTRKRVPQFGR